MTTNRSSEELAMRDAVETWGRARWPDARVVHELVTEQCRIDMAFVRPEHLIGVEIKSSRDVLDRLDAQMKTFCRLLPETWIAVAPKWLDHIDVVPWSVGRLIAAEGSVTAEIPHGRSAWRHDAKPNRCITAPMLGLLWRNELLSVAIRKRLLCGAGRRETVLTLSDLLARRLTGDEIVAEVCTELRGRAAFWKADPPIREGVAELATRRVAQATLSFPERAHG